MNFFLLSFISICFFALSIHSYDDQMLRDICTTNGERQVHVSLISIPTKGHINPLLGIAETLASYGCKVTVPIVEAS